MKKIAYIIDGEFNDNILKFMRIQNFHTVNNNGTWISMQGDASCASGTYDGPEASNATCSFNPNPSMSFSIIIHIELITCDILLQIHLGQ